MSQETRIAGVQEGDLLAGKYRVDRVLGVGGMGVVVAAHHVQLDDKVAIKFLLPETLGNAEAVGRFAREARAAVKIKNEHVARVTDVGTLESGAPYMVMEYLEGGDLAGWVQSGRSIPIEQATDFVLQACEAIADAHGLGIVHRDLKPANLFCIRRDGQLFIKVLDFGISKMTSLAGSGPDMSLTKTSTVMGSPLYMSPEQMESSRNVDARSDIWALGIILYELVTGKVPFLGESLPEVCMKIATQAPPPMRNFRPDTPSGLEQVIIRCLEKDRAKRYPNVAELAMALLEFAPKSARASAERISRIIQASGLSASALALPPSSDAINEPVAGGTLSSWGRSTGPWRPAGTRVLVGIGLALVGATSLFWITRKPSAQPSTDTAIVVSPVPAAVGSSTNAMTSEVPAPVVPSPEPAVPAPSVSSAPLSPSLTPPVASVVAPRVTKHVPSTATTSMAVGVASVVATASRAAPPKPNCDPPYTIDSNGHKVPKPGCL